MCKKENHSRGLSKEDARKHAEDHLNWSRRDFMKTMGLTTSVGMLMGSVPLHAITSLGSNYTGETDRILILIRLVGGNDGLNTIIPIYDYSTYETYRPGIKHEASSLVELTEEFGIPPSAQAFESMWQKGEMKVVNGVGYPEQNLSHFRSTDIWSTAEAEQEIQSGWLGRLITMDDPDIEVDPPEHPAAIQIGNAGNFTFNNESAVNLSFQVSNTEQLFQIAENGSFYQVDGLPDCLHGSQVEFARNVANSTFRYADIIKQSYEGTENSVAYTNSELGNQLALVARLIKGGLRSSFYLVNLNGFDTHAQQRSRHDELLRYLSSNVSEFYQDLESSDDAKRVLTMTNSEFGRRPIQNASQGTDHGAAAPVMVFGPALESNGFVGEYPDLQDLDAADNLKFSTDFRQLYKTVLTDWLCFPEDNVDSILRDSYEKLDLGFQCKTTRVTAPVTKLSSVKKRRLSTEHFIFEVYLPEAIRGEAMVYDMSGNKVTSLHKGLLLKGTNEFEFRGGNYNIKSGIYIFLLRAGGSIVREQFGVFKGN